MSFDDIRQQLDGNEREYHAGGKVHNHVAHPLARGPDQGDNSSGQGGKARNKVKECRIHA
jgi:hypothetical protein